MHIRESWVRVNFIISDKFNHSDGVLGLYRRRMGLHRAQHQKR